MTRDTAIIVYKEFQNWIYRNNFKNCHRNWVKFTKAGYKAIKNEMEAN